MLCPRSRMRPNMVLQLTGPRWTRLASSEGRRDDSCWAACGQMDRRLGLERGPAAEHQVRWADVRMAASQDEHEDMPLRRRLLPWRWRSVHWAPVEYACLAGFASGGGFHEERGLLFLFAALGVTVVALGHAAVEFVGARQRGAVHPALTVAAVLLPFAILALLMTRRASNL